MPRASVPLKLDRCPVCRVGELEVERFGVRCRSCRHDFIGAALVGLENPPGRSVSPDGHYSPRASDPRHVWEQPRDGWRFDPVFTVADQIARFRDGTTFDALKAHLGGMFTARSIRDKYLRAYLEEGIRTALIIAKLMPDGAVWYHRVYIPKSGA